MTSKPLPANCEATEGATCLCRSGSSRYELPREVVIRKHWVARQEEAIMHATLVHSSKELVSRLDLFVAIAEFLRICKEARCLSEQKGGVFWPGRGFDSIKRTLHLGWASVLR